MGWALGSCERSFSHKCWSGRELAQAGPPRSSVALGPCGSPQPRGAPTGLGLRDLGEAGAPRAGVGAGHSG